MTFPDWFKREVKLRETTVAAILDEIHVGTGISITTLKAIVYGGMKLSPRYADKAEALSKHTGGVVSVEEVRR